MDAQPQQVAIYETADGRCPYIEWFESLRDKRAQRRIDARIDRVQLGNFGDCKAVGEGVIELRIDYGPGYRIYLGREGNDMVLLLLGGDKRTQDRDIAAAKENWADYKARKKEEADNGANT